MPPIAFSPSSRAMTLREAIVQLRNNNLPAGPGDPGLTNRWRETAAKGDPARFQARLAWEGLQEADVPRLAGMTAAGAEAPWWTLLESALTYFRNAHPFPEAVRLDYAADRATVPFTEIWDAFALAALDHVPAAARFPEVAWFLSRRLAPLGGPVLFDEFERFRRDYSGEGDSYRTWVTKLRSGGLEKTLEAFPMLARGLAGISLTAAQTLSELLVRLTADRVDLEDIFGPLGTLTGIDPGLSDRHYHGRQVARIRFSSGKQLIYKAKSVDLDAAFQRLLETLLTPGVPLPGPLRILCREGYGWVEHVDQVEFSELHEVEDYFRKGGGLLALVYALEGRDFIMDNLIATSQGPAAIDAEAALQPLCLPGGAEKMEREALLAQLLKGRDFSVLDTGLVPLWMPGGNGYYDMSGLGGQTGYVSALQQEQWEHVGTSAMTCVRRAVAIEPEKNRVVLRGEPQSASLYPLQIDRGFADVYQLILSRRDEILTELDSWENCQLRFLLRATNTYGQVLKRTLSPRCLTSGLLAGIEAEVLYRPFITSPVPPPIADFLKEEVTALQRWDIPCFHLSAGGETHPYFLASPLVMARDRISRLDGEDLARQRRVIRTSLTLSPKPELGGAGKPHDAFPDLTLAGQRDEPGGKPVEMRLAAEAEAIAEILEQLPFPQQGPAGVLLFEGSPGPAIFLAALAKVTGKQHYAERAARLVEDWLMDACSAEFRNAAPSLPIGGASGLASLPYSCWVLSRLLGRPDLMDRAAELTALIRPDQILADQQLDLYSGTAGVVMVCSALAEATGGASVFRERAGWGVEKLLASAVPLPGGEGHCWLACGEHYLGYGHGAAGISTALLRAARVQENAAASTMGRQSLTWLAGLEHPDAGWPGLWRDNKTHPQKMESVCHGTPGLAIAFAEAGRSHDPALLEALPRLRTRLAKLPPHPIDTLCCGNAGRLEALMAAGAPPSAVGDLLLIMLKRREPLGLFRTDLRRSDIYTCRPGFYKGLSGIGYQLLRLAAPGVLPSIAAWR